MSPIDLFLYIIAIGGGVTLSIALLFFVLAQLLD